MPRQRDVLLEPGDGERLMDGVEQQDQVTAAQRRPRCLDVTQR
jgi:hypothetical protein